MTETKFNPRPFEGPSAFDTPRQRGSALPMQTETKPATDEQIAEWASIDGEGVPYETWNEWTDALIARIEQEKKRGEEAVDDHLYVALEAENAKLRERDVEVRTLLLRIQTEVSETTHAIFKLMEVDIAALADTGDNDA